jgi:hypothetical protein
LDFRRLVRNLFCLGFLLDTYLAHTPQTQKIAEWEFPTVPTDAYGDPKQSWTLWKESNGMLRLEDHFHITNRGNVTLALMDPKLLSSELKRDLASGLAKPRWTSC